MKLSVIVPCYNERNTILQILKKIENLKLDRIEKEVIVVDDCSNDGIAEFLKGHSLDFKIKLISHSKNLGKGASIRTGFKYAEGDIIIIQDADLEYDPNDYPLLLKPILDNKADVIFGSRFIGYRPHGIWSYLHFLVNKILTAISNILTGFHLSDMETCYKAFRAEIAKNITLRENGFAFEPEFTMKIAKKHYRIMEVGISYYGRSYKEGKKITWKDGFRALWCLIKYKIID